MKMKVVCVDNKTTRFNSKREPYSKIEPLLQIGKIYEIYMTPKEFEICSVVGIVDERGDGRGDGILGRKIFDKHLFIPIDQWREIQLLKLGI
jgi:hypothetical protein